MGEFVYTQDVNGEIVMIEEPDKGSVKCWSVTPDKKCFYPETRSIQESKIYSGFYEIMYENGSGYYARKRNIETDKLIPLYNDVTEELLKETKKFWESKDFFISQGILHKRGALLFGGPGEGKSSIIHMMINEITKIGGVIFSIETAPQIYTYRSFMNKSFRIIEPETPVLLIIEDIDKLMRAEESELLNLLCGQNSVNHQFVIATTNRISELNELLLRPSRIDLIIEVKPPNEHSRKIYFSHLGMSPDEAEYVASKTEGLSIAQLKELYITVKMFEYSVDFALERIKENKTKGVKVNFTSKNSVGFK